MDNIVLEKTGFVAGGFLVESTKENIEKALEPIEGRDERIININREILEKGMVIGVWNVKQWSAAWKWIDMRIAGSKEWPFHAPPEKLEEWKKRRRLPVGRFGWNSGFNGFVLSQTVEIEVNPGEFVKKKIGSIKGNAYGLPGGMIEQYEYNESETRKKLFETATDYENSGEHYSDYAFHREWVEEVRTLAIRDKKALFERVVQFYEDSRDHPNNPTVEHEDFFFRVLEMVGALGDVGVEGETFAPELLPIMALNRHNFYNKHAHGLMAILNRAIECGEKRYEEALRYLQYTFPPCKKLRREPKVRVPEMTGLSDADIFMYTMAHDKVAPLKKDR